MKLWTTGRERCGPRKTLNLLQKWRLASANTDVFFLSFLLFLPLLPRRTLCGRFPRLLSRLASDEREGFVPREISIFLAPGVSGGEGVAGIPQSASSLCPFGISFCALLKLPRRFLLFLLFFFVALLRSFFSGSPFF